VNLLSDFAVEQLARPTSGPQNAIAVVDGERSVTYDELDRSADQVASRLEAWATAAAWRSSAATVWPASS
jgi:non-ribosomal peptide synthetase component E (peptide arylation enzyme)